MLIPRSSPITPPHQAMYDEMTAKNTAELERLDAAIKEAQKDFGETEVRETSLAKADFLCSIGDKVCHHLRVLPCSMHTTTGIAHFMLNNWHSSCSYTTTGIAHHEMYTDSLAID